MVLDFQYAFKEGNRNDILSCHLQYRCPETPDPGSGTEVCLNNVAIEKGLESDTSQVY